MSRSDRMTLYQIAGWNELFENNRTRELRRLDWVPIPNKHDGDGFTDLMSRPNGPAIYGAWTLMLQLASKCDPRGTLARGIGESPKRYSAGRPPSQKQGPENRSREFPQEGAGICQTPPTPPQTPHDATSISRITRCPVSVIEEAIRVCLEIGWLECITVNDNKLQITAGGCGNLTSQAPQIPAPGCGNSTMEGKGMEGNRIVLPIDHYAPIGAVGEIEEKPQPEKASKPPVSEQARQLAKVALTHLNEMTGSDFRSVETNIRLIGRRLDEVNCDIEGVNQMIDRQCAIWKTDERMAKYLRVETLFRASKFQSYFAARLKPVRDGKATFDGSDKW